MDIILTPAKLNGTIQARPSVTDAWLHSVAQELALLQRKRHLLPSRRGVAPRDLLKMKGCWSSDMETTCACFKCFTEDVPVLYCADSRHTLNLMLPIASALKKKVYFTGDISLADNHIIRDPRRAEDPPKGPQQDQGDLHPVRQADPWVLFADRQGGPLFHRRAPVRASAAGGQQQSPHDHHAGLDGADGNDAGCDGAVRRQNASFRG